MVFNEREILAAIVIIIAAAIAIKIVKGVARLVIAAIGIVIILSISGCGGTENTEESDSIIKKDVITADENTVSFWDTNEDMTFGVERDTEWEQMLEELNSEQQDTGNEQEILGRIQSMFTERGIVGETTLSDKQYISENIYYVYGTNTASNLVITAEVDTDTGDIDVYESGASNGSEYIVFNGIDKLNCAISDLNELLVEFGIYYDDIGIIEDVQGDTVKILLGEQEYTVNTVEKSIDGVKMRDTGDITEGTESIMEETEIE